MRSLLGDALPIIFPPARRLFDGIIRLFGEWATTEVAIKCARLLIRHLFGDIVHLFW